MNRTKNIKIQIWQDAAYIRVIGIWYPKIQDTSTLDEPQMIEPPMETSSETPMSMEESPITEVSIPMEEGAPFLIVSSSTYEPRRETVGGNPVALGQSDMPIEYIESLIRNMSYLFANEIGMFQPNTKPLTNTFIAKQTFSYKMIKEVPMEVTPVQGAMSLKDLGNYINQFTEEEQRRIQVINNVEKPVTTDGKHIEEFIFNDKNDKQAMYITVTKLHDIYETEDPYIKMTQLPTDPANESLAPGTAEAPNSEAALDLTKEAIEADDIEREALQTFDEMVNPSEEENLDEADNTLPDSDSKIKPTREEVLEKLLKDKNQQLIDAGIIEPTLPEDPLADMPEPMSQAEEFQTSHVEDFPMENDMSPEDLEYAAMTQAPEDYNPSDIDDGMPQDGGMNP